MSRKDRPAKRLDGILEQVLLNVWGTERVRYRPTGREEARALRNLRKQGLVQALAPQNRQRRPADWHTATETGTVAALAAYERREIEREGLPLEDWDPACQPWGMTRQEFEHRAMVETVSALGPDRFHTNGELMLRGPNPDWDERHNVPARMRSTSILDEAAWSIAPTKPVGYFFIGRNAYIAFEQQDVAIRADYYELAIGHCGRNDGWETLRSREQPKREALSPGYPVMVRLRGPSGTVDAYVATVSVNTAEKAFNKKRKSTKQASRA